MKNDVKEELIILLDLLSKSIKNNNVGMATDGDGNLYFFDIDVYEKTHKMSGFQVNIQTLVDGGSINDKCQWKLEIDNGEYNYLTGCDNTDYICEEPIDWNTCPKCGKQIEIIEKGGKDNA